MSNNKNNKYFIDPNPSKLSSKEISEEIIAYRELHGHPRLCIGLSRSEHNRMIANCEACKKEGRYPTDYTPPKKTTRKPKPKPKKKTLFK